MTLAPAAGCASEVFRPRFHFTPPFGWMKDPVGLSYFRGEWHLYYQFFPFDTVWGPMHWGHAVSRDLVRWEDLPIALAPIEPSYIYSGSVVYDAAERALAAIFTSHHHKDHVDLVWRRHGLAAASQQGRKRKHSSPHPAVRCSVKQHPGTCQG